MLHFDDISLFTQEEKEVHPGLYQRKIEVGRRRRRSIPGSTRGK